MGTSSLVLDTTYGMFLWTAWPRSADLKSRLTLSSSYNCLVLLEAASCATPVPDGVADDGFQMQAGVALPILSRANVVLQARQGADPKEKKVQPVDEDDGA